VFCGGEKQDLHSHRNKSNVMGTKEVVFPYKYHMRARQVPWEPSIATKKNN